MVGAEDEPVTQNQLAAFVEADPMMTSTVTRKLVTQGLVSREEHLDDARAKCVALSAEGQEKVLAASESVDAFEQNFRVLAIVHHFFRKAWLRFRRNKVIF